MCYIGSNDILFSKPVKLENLKKQNIMTRNSDIYIRYNNNKYLNTKSILSEDKVVKSALFCKTNNVSMKNKINQQFK